MSGLKPQAFTLVLFLLFIFSPSSAPEASPPSSEEAPGFYGIPLGSDTSRESAFDWESTNGPWGAVPYSMETTSYGTLLVGTENGGLYRSEDGGQSWVQSDDGLTWPCCNYNVPALSATASACFLGTWGGGVFRSDDDGLFWYPTGTVPGDGYPIVRALAACHFGETVYAGGNFGVARSDDGGGSWYNVNDGLPGSWVTSLALRGPVLYAMLSEGVYRLDPDTSIWSECNDGLFATYGQQSLCATVENLFLSTHEGGVFHLDCEDDGWVPLNDGLWDDNADALIEVDRRYYVGTMGSGVFAWNYETSAWDWKGEGLTNTDVRLMASRGLTPYAGTYGGGIYDYDAELELWSSSNFGLSAALVRDIACDGSIIYAGLVGGGVWTSSDQGDNWIPASDGPGEINVHELAYDGTAVYAGTWNGVWKSIDQGQTWTASGMAGNGIFALTAEPAIIYAGTFWGEVWYSSDGGASWDPVGSGLPASIVHDIAVSGTTLYATTIDQGVWRLEDGESTWVAINTDLPELTTWSLGLHEGELFVGHHNSGVSRWNEGSQSWDSTGLTTGTAFRLASVEGWLMAGTWGILYATEDLGGTWIDAGSGLRPWLGIQAIAPCGDRIYLGMDGGGVWRSIPPTAVDEPEEVDLFGTGSDRLRILPNPFIDGARIVFQLSKPERVTLSVYDVSGRMVARLAEGSLDAGEHERAWDGTMADGSKAAAGMYLVRLQAGARESITKTVSLR